VLDEVPAQPTPQQAMATISARTVSTLARPHGLKGGLV